MLSHAVLLETLDYDPENGKFTWKVERKGVKSHQESGFSHKLGYWCICLNQKTYLAHRLAWFYVYGRWPIGEIDHINRDKRDNRISNLREVTSGENKRNKGPSKRNKSGTPGVYWREKYLHWEVYICVDRRQKHLGCFHSKELAIAARRKAEVKYGFTTT